MRADGGAMPWRLVAPGRPWGDYGRILWDGMTGHLGRADGLLQLERAAPFVPELTFPGLHDVVVRERLRRALDASGLTGLGWQRVVKARIVELNWHRWDAKASRPAQRPRGGEPENYVLALPHAEPLARGMGEVWELCPPRVGTVRRVEDATARWGKRVEVAFAQDSPDFARAADDFVHDTWVSDRAREWLERSVPGQAAFEQA